MPRLLASGWVATVLTVRKIGVAIGDWKGALAAARYPLELSDSPAAFREDGDASPGRGSPDALWVGSERALAELGLRRGQEVLDEDLALALQGRSTETGVQVRKPGSRPVREQGGVRLGKNGKPLREQVVNSFDLTFSAPKSVSVLWSQADPELRAEIERAMVEAANAALEHITQTRLVVGGEEVAQGFAASMALHVKARTARDEAAPSPQLHVHCHLVGVLDGEGKLRTPHSEALFKHSAPRAAGAVGRAVLAERLKALGFQIEWGTGRGGRYFEIDGVPKGLCERLSGRMREVLWWIAQREGRLGGELSSSERAEGALKTRSGKTDHSLEECQDVWDAHAQDFHWGRSKIEVLRARSAPEESVEVLREQLRENVLRRMWEEGPAISTGALESIAFELAPMGLSLEEAGRVLQQLQREGELIAVDGWRVTTRDIREREQHVARVAAEAAQRPGEALSAEAVAHGIRVAEARLGGHELYRDQKVAVDVLTSGGGWMCLTGRAGTGKGPVLQAVAEAHRHDGWRVIGCAVDGATKERLGQQIGAQALTLEQLFHRLGEGSLRVDRHTLIVIDEASKVGLRDWDRLVSVVEASRATIVPVGDIQQIGAIECPGMLDVMLADRRIRTAKLKKVRRHLNPADRSQPHPWLGDYLDALYEGKAKTAIDTLRANDAITMHATRHDAMVGLVEKWEERRREHGIAAKDTMLIVHGSNDDVDLVNGLAQERRREAGELPGPGVQASDREYLIYKNDVVMLRESAYQPDREESGAPRPDRAENGTVGIVERVDAGRRRVWVAFDQPGGGTRTVIIDLAELAARGQQPGDRTPSLRLAYAWHPYPAQGANREYIGSLWGHKTQRKEETYSGDARPICWLDVHTDRESMGWEGTDNDRYRRFAKRLKRPWHRVASITFDETPNIPILRGLAHVEAVYPDREADGQPAATDPGVRVDDPDPLAAYRYRLGPDRLRTLARLIDASAEEVAHLDEEALGAARDEGRAAAARLDGDAALAARRIEEYRASARERIEVAGARAYELDAEAAAERGLGAGQLRKEREEAAEALRQGVRLDKRRLAQLANEERALGDHHPDAWLGTDGPTFAKGLAAERELARRLEPQVGTEEAVDQPLAPERTHEPPGPELT